MTKQYVFRIDRRGLRHRVYGPRTRPGRTGRVLEIPTSPWCAYDAFRFGIDIPEGAPTSQQERAYTSPIWYTPRRP